MAWRLRLAPEKTNFNFFAHQWLTFGGSMLLMVAAFACWGLFGLNFGIDFKGGTTIRTDSPVTVDVGAYRAALSGLKLGDVAINEVFDPSFRADQHVANIRISAVDGVDSISPETLDQVKGALTTMDPKLVISAVESVGPKVSGELVTSSIIAVAVTSIAIMGYIWLRFEWQFALGGVLALLHDVFITIGVFALFQIKFDLTIVAALLTILGYSINDTVVVFDRLRENLIKYKTMPLRDVMNLSVNETLSRTLMTSITTLIAVGSMLVLGGDVIRGFSFAIFMGVLLGTYSSVYVAKNLVLFLGLDRSEKVRKTGKGADHEFANIDA
jgi:preprotein translocase subunit SecF